MQQGLLHICENKFICVKNTRGTAFPTRLHVCQAKHSRRSESSLCSWKRFGSLTTHRAPCEDSDQTARMRSLIRVFAGRTCNLVGNAVSLSPQNQYHIRVRVTEGINFLQCPWKQRHSCEHLFISCNAITLMYFTVLFRQTCLNKNLHPIKTSQNTALGHSLQNFSFSNFRCTQTTRKIHYFFILFYFYFFFFYFLCIIFFFFFFFFFDPAILKITNLKQLIKWTFFFFFFFFFSKVRVPMVRKHILGKYGPNV